MKDFRLTGYKLKLCSLLFIFKTSILTYMHQIHRKLFTNIIKMAWKLNLKQWLLHVSSSIFKKYSYWEQIPFSKGALSGTEQNTHVMQGQATDINHTQGQDLRNMSISTILRGS